MKLITKFLILSFFLTGHSLAEVKMGAEGGLVWADIRAEETAQILANASGSTVTANMTKQRRWVNFCRLCISDKYMQNSDIF